jgi:tetratricopeptide (TPR) repeat protein
MGLVVLTAIAAVVIVTSARRSALYVDLERRWQDAVEKTPTNGRAYDNLASAALRADPPRIAKADSVLHVAMTVDPTFVPAWVRTATIARAQGRLTDAQSLLEHALMLHPGDAAATKVIGEVFVAEKRPDLALPYLRQFAAFAPSGESLTTLGVAYLGMRQLDSGVAVLERAARLDSARVDTRRYLAATLIELERGADAIPYAEQAIRLDSTSAVTLGLLSLSYAQAGRADDASRTAQLAAARAPDNATILVFVGRAMQTAGRYADAAGYLIKAVRLTPNDPQALTRLGMVEASLGNKALAKKLFERVLNGMPDYELAQRALAQLGRTSTGR